MPPLYRVPLSPRDGSATPKPILPVNYRGQHQGYATYKNGCYEFSVTESLREQIADGTIDVTFEPPGDVPTSIELRPRT
jgi:hypothetical protein